MTATAEREAAVEQLTVGLIAPPGMAGDLAEELARELPDALHTRFPRVDWQFVVRGEVRAGPGGVGEDLVGLARERMLSERWDLAICLTELPLQVGRRPVTAYASVALGVGVISVPALGAVNLDDRIREAIIGLVERIVGAEEHDGEVRFEDRAVRGNTRLLVGMIRANRPWRLAIRLSRALAAALGGAAFTIVSPAVWMVSDGASVLRMLVLAFCSILATTASVIVAHRLWESSPSPAARERVALLNLSVLLTTVIGIASLYAALFAINAITGGLLIPSEVLAKQLGHPAGVGDYLGLAWLVSSLATIGGALGAVVESNLAVREAVFGYRAADGADGNAA
jgi:hypothetical protein